MKPIWIAQNEYFWHNKGFAGITRFWTQGMCDESDRCGLRSMHANSKGLFYYLGNKYCIKIVEYSITGIKLNEKNLFENKQNQSQRNFLSI